MGKWKLFFFRLWNSSVLWRAYLLWEEVYMRCSVMQFVRETWICGPFLDSSGNFRALKAVLSSPCLHSGSTFYSIENDTVMVRLAWHTIYGHAYLMHDVILSRTDFAVIKKRKEKERKKEYTPRTLLHLHHRWAPAAAAWQEIVLRRRLKERVLACSVGPRVKPALHIERPLWTVPF